MEHISEIFEQSRVIPVLNFTSAEEAVAVSTALYEGGLSVLEITLRHPSALQAIHAVRAALPDAIVGAGTVTTPSRLHQAMEAGSQFGVSPGLTVKFSEHILKSDLPFLPGIASISEAMTAVEAGFKHLKCFPANVVGGPAFLKAIGSVLPDLTFCPTGGVTADTASDYLALKNVGAVGGSWLTPRGEDGEIDLKQVKEKAEAAARL